MRKNHVTSGRVAREGRQQRAAERAKAREGRTAKQQVARIAKRPGSSSRELARLQAQL